MITIIPITKARVNLGEVIKRVHLNKDSFALEKGGIPAVAILDIDEFKDLLERRKNEKIAMDFHCWMSLLSFFIWPSFRSGSEGSQENP
jgi:hypothetical protein